MVCGTTNQTLTIYNRWRLTRERRQFYDYGTTRHARNRLYCRYSILHFCRLVHLVGDVLMSEKTIKIFDIDIMGKPRMTQRDKWAKRDCVQRYYAFKDRLKLEVGSIDFDVKSLSWTAYIAMPKSWSKKKRKEMELEPHRQKPDRDNIDKAILDSLFKDDSGIYQGNIMKLWASVEHERSILFITISSD